MNTAPQNIPVEVPTAPSAELFTDPKAAVDRLCELYSQAINFLSEKFSETIELDAPTMRYRAFYPEIRLTTTSHARVDSRLSFGHVAGPGTYSTTITRPDLFENYLMQQLQLLMDNHGVGVWVGPSKTVMPVHFAVANDANLVVPQDGAMSFSLRDVFDVPDLATTNDDIVNGTSIAHADGSTALAPFTAQRID
jgi:AMP nucleosidase